MTRSIHRLLGLTLAALPVVPALAGRPLQTEDAGVLPRGGCEVEGAMSELKDHDAAERARVLQLACGIGAATQLALAVARVRTDAAEQAVELNGKTGLWRGGDGDDAPALTLAYTVIGARLGGASWHHVGTGARLVHTRLLHSDWLLHANLGHLRNERSHASSTTWGLAIEHTGIGAIAPMAELFGQDRAPAWWNLGVRAALVRDALFVDASFGQQMNAARSRLLTVGFKVAF